MPNPAWPCLGRSESCVRLQVSHESVCHICVTHVRQHRTAVTMISRPVCSVWSVPPGGVLTRTPPPSRMHMQISAQWALHRQQPSSSREDSCLAVYSALLMLPHGENTPAKVTRCILLGMIFMTVSRLICRGPYSAVPLLCGSPARPRPLYKAFHDWLRTVRDVSAWPITQCAEQALMLQAGRRSSSCCLLVCAGGCIATLSLLCCSAVEPCLSVLQEQ